MPTRLTNLNFDVLDRAMFAVKWLSAGFTAAVAGSAFGPRTVLVGLVVLMGIDWVTGLNTAYIQGTVSSEIGKKGLVLKGQILLLILAVHVLEEMAGYEMQLELWGAGGFCVNEVISIIENVTKSGVKVPSALVQALIKVKKLSPAAATRAELDQLRDDARDEADQALLRARDASDNALSLARAELDRKVGGLPAPVVITVAVDDPNQVTPRH